MIETPWTEARATKAIRKSTVLLDLNSEKTDEEIWANFNSLINENIVSDYTAEFCGYLCESSFPMRLSLVTEYLPTVVKRRKKELAIFAIAICTNHNKQEQALQYINEYKTNYGTDKVVLVEELNYYTSFEPGNIEKISSIMTEIETFGEI